MNISSSNPQHPQHPFNQVAPPFVAPSVQRPVVIPTIDSPQVTEFFLGIQWLRQLVWEEATLPRVREVLAENNIIGWTDDIITKACELANVPLVPEPDPYDPETTPAPLMPNLEVLQTLKTVMATLQTMRAELQAMNVSLTSARTLAREERDFNRQFMQDLSDKFDVHFPSKA